MFEESGGETNSPLSSRKVPALSQKRCPHFAEQAAQMRSYEYVKGGILEKTDLGWDLSPIQIMTFWPSCREFLKTEVDMEVAFLNGAGIKERRLEVYLGDPDGGLVAPGAFLLWGMQNSDGTAMSKEDWLGMEMVDAEPWFVMEQRQAMSLASALNFSIARYVVGFGEVSEGIKVPQMTMTLDRAMRELFPNGDRFLEVYDEFKQMNGKETQALINIAKLIRRIMSPHL
jgi:hypothetical protein